MYSKFINNLEQTMDFLQKLKFSPFTLMGIFVIWKLYFIVISKNKSELIFSDFWTVTIKHQYKDCVTSLNFIKRSRVNFLQNTNSLFATLNNWMYNLTS